MTTTWSFSYNFFVKLSQLERFTKTGGEFNNAIITLLNDSACSIKMAGPCNKQIKWAPLVHTKKHTWSFQKSSQKILRALSLTKTHYCFGSHLGIIEQRENTR